MNKKISIKGANANNLNNIDLEIPWYSLSVITGLSGSGKSSLALDTIHSESRRRYLESMSTYARQFLEKIEKPDVYSLEGLPPSICIESRNNIKNSRSTVGTMTEIYDFIRIIFSKIGEIHCPECGDKCENLSNSQICDNLIKEYKDEKIYICGKNIQNISTKELKKIGVVEHILNGKPELLNISSEEKINFPLFDNIQSNLKNKSRIIESLELAFQTFKTVTIFDNSETNESKDYKKEFSCPNCLKEYKSLSPNKFSFNSPDGACKECKGFGNVLLPDIDLLVQDKNLSIHQGCISILNRPSLSFPKKRFMEFCNRLKIDTEIPFKKLSKKTINLLLNGDDEYKGLRGIFKRLEAKAYKMHVRVLLSKYRSPNECIKCNGSKVGVLASNVKLKNKTLKDIGELNVDDLLKMFTSLKVKEKDLKIIDEPMKQIKSRLKYLREVGLDYLTMSRLSRTLSGGEAQRVNLAQQLGSELTDTLYVLDEPSIGLHQMDVEKLFKTIKDLQYLDNTVILIEHDLDIIKKADWIVEMGPKAGQLGGDVVYYGNPKGLKKNHNSITGKYLFGKEKIEIPNKRRKANEFIIIKGASKNNIKNVDIRIPLNLISAITGVSGSGKSSLIYDCFYGNAIKEFGQSFENAGNIDQIKGLKNIDEIVMITQEPIGKSTRSNPASYLKIYDEIRKIMSETEEARELNFTPGNFSFNTAGGRCEHCKGEGKETIEMQFLSDVEIECEVCNGKRFKDEILNIKFLNKNIIEILDLTIDEATIFFKKNKKIIELLNILVDVGLGYLKLGQPSSTLSGGESQRIKIAKYLTSKNKKNVLFILDEPSVGLHVDDLRKLIKTFNMIVDRGNTVLIIEHNIDIIKIADYVIDIGPGGGDKGGNVIACGTPEEISKNTNSVTGKYLNI